MSPETLAPSLPFQPHVEMCLRLVGKVWGIEPERIRSRDRDRATVEARQVAIWLAYMTASDITQRDIATVLGLNTSTVSWAMYRVSNYRKTKPLFKARLHLLETQMLEETEPK